MRRHRETLNPYYEVSEDSLRSYMLLEKVHAVWRKPTIWTRLSYADSEVGDCQGLVRRERSWAEQEDTEGRAILHDNVDTCHHRLRVRCHGVLPIVVTKSTKMSVLIKEVLFVGSRDSWNLQISSQIKT